MRSPARRCGAKVEVRVHLRAVCCRHASLAVRRIGGHAVVMIVRLEVRARTVMRGRMTMRQAVPDLRYEGSEAQDQPEDQGEQARPAEAMHGRQDSTSSGMMRYLHKNRWTAHPPAGMPPSLTEIGPDGTLTKGFISRQQGPNSAVDRFLELPETSYRTRLNSGAVGDGTGRAARPLRAVERAARRASTFKSSDVVIAFG